MVDRRSVSQVHPRKPVSMQVPNPQVATAAAHHTEHDTYGHRLNFYRTAFRHKNNENEIGFQDSPLCASFLVPETTCGGLSSIATCTDSAMFSWEPEEAGRLVRGKRPTLPSRHWTNRHERERDQEKKLQASRMSLGKNHVACASLVE